MFNDLLTATGETILMTFSSLAIAYIFAIPIGFIAYETAENGLFPNKLLNKITNVIIAIGRAIPFIILMVLLLPITRFIVGSGIGTKAVIFPLSVCAIPFASRMVENSLTRIDKLIVVASRIDNAPKMKIMFKIEFLYVLPDLIEGFGNTGIAILGYTTMAGTVGGGGLGNYAIVYGFQRYNWLAVFYSTIIIVLMVFAIQSICKIIAKKIRR